MLPSIDLVLLANVRWNYEWKNEGAMIRRRVRRRRPGEERPIPELNWSTVLIKSWSRLQDSLICPEEKTYNVRQPLQCANTPVRTFDQYRGTTSRWENSVNNLAAFLQKNKKTEESKTRTSSKHVSYCIKRKKYLGCCRRWWCGPSQAINQWFWWGRQPERLTRM